MKNKSTEAQVVFALRQSESGTPIAAIIAKWKSSRSRFIVGKRSMRGWESRNSVG